MAKSFRPFFRPRKYYKRIVMPLHEDESKNTPDQDIEEIGLKIEVLLKEFVAKHPGYLYFLSINAEKTTARPVGYGNDFVVKAEVKRL